MDKYIETAICQALSLRILEAGQTGRINLPNKPAKTFYVEHIWIGQIRFYFPSLVTLAGIRYSDHYKALRSHRAVMLVRKPVEEFLGITPFQGIELGHTLDPVAQALQDMTFFPHAKGIIPDESSSRGDPSFLVETHSPNAIVKLYCVGFAEDEKTQNLWGALLTICKTLKEAYADPEIDAFFARESFFGSRRR